jgi:hypothetical protein
VIDRASYDKRNSILRQVARGPRPAPRCGRAAAATGVLIRVTTLLF